MNRNVVIALVFGLVVGLVGGVVIGHFLSPQRLSHRYDLHVEDATAWYMVDSWTGRVWRQISGRFQEYDRGLKDAIAGVTTEDEDRGWWSSKTLVERDEYIKELKEKLTEATTEKEREDLAGHLQASEWLRRCVKSHLFADIYGHGKDSLPLRPDGRPVETDRAVNSVAQTGRAPAQRRSARSC